MSKTKRSLARGRIRKLIERTDKIELLVSMWVLDRAWHDPKFRLPSAYDYPQELIGASIDSPISVRPWEIETIITEILACPRKFGDRRGNPRSWAFMSKLFNALRHLEEGESKTNRETIFRELTRIALRQFRWQSKNWHAAEYVRWWSIFGNPTLREIFKYKNGIEIDKFIVVGFIWNLIFNNNSITKFPHVDNIVKLTNGDVEKFARVCVIEIDDAIKDSMSVKRESTSVAYRRSIFRKTPIISFNSNLGKRYIRPMELLLKWRLTSGLYYDVISDNRSANLIGLEFENYVRDLLSANFASKKFFEKITYGRKGLLRESPDILLGVGSIVEFVVECKATKLPLSVQTDIDESEQRDRVISEIAKGVLQICIFEEDVSSGMIKDIVLSDEIFPIVLTLDDWILFGQDIKKDIFERAAEMAERVGLKSDRLEQRDVIVCTANELETVITLYEDEGVYEVLRKSLNKDFKDFAISGVMTSFKDGRRSEPQNPLMQRAVDMFDQFLES